MPAIAPATTPYRDRGLRVSLSGLLFFTLFLALNPIRGRDLRVYLQAAQRFWAGVSLYQPSDGVMHFKYAPPVAWLMSPFLLAPDRLASPLWNLAMVSVLTLVVRLLLSRFLELREASGWLLGLALLVLGQSFLLELNYGQVNLLMLALLVPAMLLRDRPWVAGTCLSLAILLKPPALIVVIVLLIERRWRTLVAGALTLGALWIPVLLRYGSSGAVELVRTWHSLVDETTAPWVLGNNSQGWPTTLLSLALPSHTIPTDRALLIAGVVSALVLLAAILAVWSDEVLRIALTCAGVALLSPHCWRANFVQMLPLIWLALVRGPTWDRAMVALFGVVGVVVSPLLPPMPFDWIMHLRPFVWPVTGLMATMIWTSRKRSAVT